MSCHVTLDAGVVRAVGAVILSDGTVCLHVCHRIDGATGDGGCLL